MAVKSNKKQVEKKSKKPSNNRKFTIWRSVKRDFSKLSQQRRSFLNRRPHRSFRLTRRRDYRRSLNIPGYWSLTSEVHRLIWRNKRAFLALIAVMSILTFALSSVMSQDTYQQLRDVMNQAKEGGIGEVYTTISLFSGVMVSYFSGSGTAGGNIQQMSGVFLGLLTWLSSVWLTRAILIGKKPKMRDALYSSGSPIIALIIVIGIFLIQMVPAAIAVIVYSALDASGVLNQTPILMAAGGAAILIVSMSVYWATSTVFAMIIITLPGMYPLHALRLSGDIVTGRRVRILLRFIWAVVMIILLWAIILIPTILFDGVLKGWFNDINWLPIVPTVGLILMYASIILMSVYVYMFYRKVVESDSKKSKSR